MDILHHSVIGLIGVNVALDLDCAMIGYFFLLGSILPDLDAFLVVLNKRLYLKNHQGFSHSLLLAPVYAFILVFVFTFWIDFLWMNYMGLLLGIFVHSILDYSNTYGIKLFYPLSNKRFSLDAIFFIDTFLILLTLSMYIYHYNISIYLGLFLLYIGAKIVMQRYIKQKLNASFVIPSAFNPFEFFIYIYDKKRIEIFRYTLFSDKKRDYKKIENQDEIFYYLTQKSSLFKDIQKISKALHIVKVSKSNQKIIIEAKDLAVRNFGMKFATTTLEFNLNGDLLYETSNI